MVYIISWVLVLGPVFFCLVAVLSVPPTLCLQVVLLCSILHTWLHFYIPVFAQTIEEESFYSALQVTIYGRQRVSFELTFLFFF